MTTRSMAKLEEQTALMLASLQEQGQQQAQQLRQQIDLLALNQDQQQRELVDQFSKMTEWSGKQEGLEKRLATLEEDLQLMRVDEQERREVREHRLPSIENPISGDAAERVGCIPCNLQGPGNFEDSWNAYIAQFEMLAWLNCWTTSRRPSTSQ